MTWLAEWDVVGRIVLAAVLGAAIGFERDIDDHPAGTRTTMAVAMGAALFGAVSTTGFDDFVRERSATNIQVDVTRVASQVVVGISFLGAGLIFRRSSTVENLTTAASLWCTAAIGLAAGVGAAGLAVVTTLVLLCVLAVMPRPTTWLTRRFGRIDVRLEIEPAEGVEGNDLKIRLAALEGCRLTTWRAEKRERKTIYVAAFSVPTSEPIDDQITDLATSGLVDELRMT